VHYLFFVTSFGTIPYSYGKGSEFFSSKNGCLDTEKWKNTDSQWALSLTRLLKLHLVTKPPWQYCLSVALCFSGDRVGQNFRFFLLQDHCITLCTRMPFPAKSFSFTRSTDRSTSSKAEALTDSMMRDAMMMREIDKLSQHIFQKDGWLL